MRPWLRRFGLTAHVAVSVGWLGVVAASLALGVAGLVSDNAQTVHAAYRSLELITWSLLVPLAFTSLITGTIQSLGTSWGVFRHYWVFFKLVINVLAIIILLMYAPTLSYLARITADGAASVGDLSTWRSPSVVLHASAALVALLVATILSIYKPQGRTPFGRLQDEHRGLPGPSRVSH